MHAWVGTSGYQYRAWRGSFYSERCREPDMLEQYAAKLRSVEVNSTFYRMPKPGVLAHWRATVGDDFRFAIKASQRISHRKRLRECAEPVDYLLSLLSHLGEQLGPVLVQLPPTLRRDDDRLADFLALWPQQVRVAIEFRHDSWFDEAVFAHLRDAGVALCIADVDGAPLSERFVATAGWGYLRLRRGAYDDAALDDLAQRMRAPGWHECFAYFKHEDSGPALAQGLVGRLSA